MIKVYFDNTWSAVCLDRSE